MPLNPYLHRSLNYGQVLLEKRLKGPLVTHLASALAEVDRVAEPGREAERARGDGPIGGILPDKAVNRLT